MTYKELCFASSNFITKIHKCIERLKELWTSLDEHVFTAADFTPFIFLHIYPSWLLMCFKVRDRYQCTALWQSIDYSSVPVYSRCGGNTHKLWDNLKWSTCWVAANAPVWPATLLWDSTTVTLVHPAGPFPGKPHPSHQKLLLWLFTSSSSAYLRASYKWMTGHRTSLWVRLTAQHVVLRFTYGVVLHRFSVLREVICVLALGSYVTWCL